MNLSFIYRTVLVMTFAYFFIQTGICSDDNNEKISLVFTIHQERDVYDESDFGEPPQCAIWLEDPESKEVRTIYITNRTATGNFKDRVSCPLSLPLWIGVFRQETGRTGFPTPWEPFCDAVTAATPKKKELKITAGVPAGTVWNYYIEMNVAGDYNSHFPSRIPDRGPDNYGNGQPSILYKGKIRLEVGQSSTPQIIGRSHQYYFKTEVIPDLNGIDSAKKVFSLVLVTCESL